jgi:hypothetical protein
MKLFISQKETFDKFSLILIVIVFEVWLFLYNFVNKNSKKGSVLISHRVKMIYQISLENDMV